MPDENQQKRSNGFIGRILSMPNDSISKTVLMTVLVCLVCAVFVASAAISLKQKQETNKLLDKQQNILKVAGLDDDSQSIEERFAQIEEKIVDLNTGEYVDDVDVNTYDDRAALRNPEQSIAIPKDKDIAGLRRRANDVTVYLVKGEEGQVSKIILPISGYGLWSTLYGFVSLEPDLTTIYRIIFYEHAETPGLGGEVDNPNWRKLWTGKEFFDQEGRYDFKIIKGVVVTSDPEAIHKVDGLAGATLTSVGVDNMCKKIKNKEL